MTKYFYVAVTATIMACLALLAYRHLFLEKESITPIIITISSGVATFGWISQQIETRKSNKTNHTITILQNSKFNTQFQDAVRTVDEKIRILDLEKLDIRMIHNYHSGDGEISGDQRLLIYYCRYLISYYEFIAYLVKNKHIDEKIAKENIGTNVPYMNHICKPLILYVRGEINERGEQTGSIKYPKAYENLIWWAAVI